MSDALDYAHDALIAPPLNPRDADPRKVMVPFDLLWLHVTYRRWPQDDHWREPLITNLDLYADEQRGMLLVDGLTLEHFTADQASIIEQNLDVVLTRARVRR